MVKPEAELTDDHVVVCVRHPTKGNITLMFLHNQTMMDVYFWVGSLTRNPLYFQLTDCDNTPFRGSRRHFAGGAKYGCGGAETGGDSFVNKNYPLLKRFLHFVGFVGESYSCP